MPYENPRLLYPVWETYERHVSASRKDRPKHYPGGTLTRHMTDTVTWRTYEQRLNSMMQRGDDYTTAEYVEQFCNLNNLAR